MPEAAAPPALVQIEAHGGSAATLEAPSQAGGVLADLKQNLIVGLRLAFLIRTGVTRLRLAPEQLIALVSLDLLLNFVASFLITGFDGYFNLWALPRALMYLPFLMLTAYVIARREHQPPLILALTIALISAGLPVEIVARAGAAVLGFTSIGDGRWASYISYYGVVLWWLTVIGCTIFRFTSGSRLYRLGHCVVAVVLMVVPDALIPSGIQGDLWAAPNRDSESTRKRDDFYAAAKEENIYAQPEILARELAALRPQRNGVTDLYFIGFAGYASEDVFMKEIDVVSRLFSERFDAKGRMLALVNNPKTLDRFPIATRTSLSRALGRIGAIIDREEDVLFLYLTSHGSEQHQFAVEFWPFQLKNIDPPALKQMLDASGIKWRVIVISACYAGGFIETLKDDFTLVVTAADATHTSFGCGSESDFTYFGKAYFDQALRHTYSFTDAFDDAKTRIEQREKSEGRTASYPQIYAGSAIKKKLANLERRLAAAAR
jgi:hypothetical protein